MKRLNILDMLTMEDSDFVKYLLADATKEEKEAFFSEFPETKKQFENYLIGVSIFE